MKLWMPLKQFQLSLPMPLKQFQQLYTPPQPPSPLSLPTSWMNPTIYIHQAKPHQQQRKGLNRRYGWRTKLGKKKKRESSLPVKISPLHQRKFNFNFNFNVSCQPPTQTFQSQFRRPYRGQSACPCGEMWCRCDNLSLLTHTYASTLHYCRWSLMRGGVTRVFQSFHILRVPLRHVCRHHLSSHVITTLHFTITSLFFLSPSPPHHTAHHYTQPPHYSSCLPHHFLP